MGAGVLAGGLSAFTPWTDKTETVSTPSVVNASSTPVNTAVSFQQWQQNSETTTPFIFTDKQDGITYHLEKSGNPNLPVGVGYLEKPLTLNTKQNQPLSFLFKDEPLKTETGRGILNFALPQNHPILQLMPLGASHVATPYTMSLQQGGFTDPAQKTRAILWLHPENTTLKAPEFSVDMDVVNRKLFTAPEKRGWHHTWLGLRPFKRETVANEIIDALERTFDFSVLLQTMTEIKPKTVEALLQLPELMAGSSKQTESTGETLTKTVKTGKKVGLIVGLSVGFALLGGTIGALCFPNKQGTPNNR
jgi:hypothetical protein